MPGSGRTDVEICLGITILMNSRTLLLILAVAFTVPSLLPLQDAVASGPVIARGAQRDAIKSQHILNREYRPGHFYGNAVRRRHARGR
jgi:hypothetical protein